MFSVFGKFRHKAADTGLPRTVTRKSTYILPTRHGLLFILILAAMLAGSINYNNNLGFLLVFLLGAMALVSMFHTHRNLLGIKILSVSAKPVFAGDTAVFKILVSPEGLWRKALVWTIEKPRYITEDIAPGSEAAIAVKATADKRGILRPGPLRISTRFPLGLFYAWTNISLNLSCVVYPKPLATPFEIHETVEGKAESETNRTGSGVDDFMGLKIYQTGDPVRNISWKTFSRGQGLFTKDFSGHGISRPVFDYKMIRGQDMETRLSHLCDLILKAAAANMEYGLKLPGAFIAPARDESHRHGCLKALALFNPDS